MKTEVFVHYLLHSGFAVEVGGNLLIFDYYRDDKKVVNSLIKKAQRTYFFSSHAHYDHFDAKIADFAIDVTQYFISSDIKNVAGAAKLPPEKTVYLNTYDAYKSDDIVITTYSSTDEGTCFHVMINGVAIFHAGDFNWWHWKGESEINNKFARNGFNKQLKKMAGMQADVAFFPTDSRQEEFAGLGAKEFCRECNIGYLIGMHAHGVEWCPEADFFADGRDIPTWCPTKPGEQRTIIIRGEE